MTAKSGADVVVIGGGVEGTSCAYQLTKRGLNVTLVEARELAKGEPEIPIDALMLERFDGPAVEPSIDRLAG